MKNFLGIIRTVFLVTAILPFVGRSESPEENIRLQLPGGVELVMVKIKAGSFVMGSPKGELGRKADEGQHRVTLTKDFWIGKFEVTQSQWFAVMQAYPGRFLVSSKKKGGNYPIYYVSWKDARRFCITMNMFHRDKLPRGYRFDLPTVAQWEYACRAGTTTALNNGKNLTCAKGNCPNLNETCWYKHNRRGEFSEAHEVGKKVPNAWGLYDMHGNVAEWCWDVEGNYPLEEVTDPTGPGTITTYYKNEIRGGSFYSEPEGCRSAARESYDVANSFVGFRLAIVPGQDYPSPPDNPDSLKFLDRSFKRRP